MPTDEPETTPDVVEPAPEVAEPAPAKQPKPAKSKKAPKVKAILDEIDENEPEPVASKPEPDLAAANQARKDRNASVRRKVASAIVTGAAAVAEAFIPAGTPEGEAVRLLALAAKKKLTAGRRKS